MKSKISENFVQFLLFKGAAEAARTGEGGRTETSNAGRKVWAIPESSHRRRRFSWRGNSPGREEGRIQGTKHREF